MPHTLDFTTNDFARLLDTLPAHLPLSDEYDAQHPQKNGRWWSSQREHMVGWFTNQDTHGSGDYSRHTPNSSAKRAYNRLLAPGALLWIAEAVGVEPATVQKAADIAVAETDHRRRCGKIRSVLTWELVAGAASAKADPLPRADTPTAPTPKKVRARRMSQPGMDRSLATRRYRARRGHEKP